MFDSEETCIFLNVQFDLFRSLCLTAEGRLQEVEKTEGQRYERERDTLQHSSLSPHPSRSLIDRNVSPAQPETGHIILTLGNPREKSGLIVCQNADRREPTLTDCCVMEKL